MTKQELLNAAADAAADAPTEENKLQLKRLHAWRVR